MLECWLCEELTVSLEWLRTDTPPICPTCADWMKNGAFKTNPSITGKAN